MLQIPCKHVFCLACGKQEQKQCPRCLDKVSRVEQTGLGTVFMCTHGGTRYGSSGCRRTYLSQRDLQAHINHRHVSSLPQPMDTLEDRAPLRPKTAGDPRTPMSISTNVRQRSVQQCQTSAGVRTNLITVPIQDSVPLVHETVAPAQTYYNQYQQTPTYTQTAMPPMHIPPPQQPQYYAAPPAYSPAQNYSPYTSNAPPVTPQYATSASSQARPAPQYDYSAASQWTSNQQYYR